MLDYNKLDKEFDKVINSISDEEVRKWDLFDELRLITEKFDELSFTNPLESIDVVDQILVEVDGFKGLDFCGDNRFALAA